MTWYVKKILLNTESGEQHYVFTGISEWEYNIYPTMFFNYFRSAPVFNAITECLNILDLTDENDLLQEEDEE